MTDAQIRCESKWRRGCIVLLGLWLCSTVVMSFRSVRGFVALPLFAHNANAFGDAAYVMADGYAYWERLHAASVLYHTNRVPRIIILDEQESIGFNFVHQELETRVERAIAYLGLLGVPAEKITAVCVETDATFGSLSEARAVARSEPHLERVVVVTSAPHTRRSQLCFARSFPKNVHIDVFSASEPMSSAEIDAPLWIEYCKLVVYYFCA